MSWFTLSLISMFALATAELTQQHLLTKENAVNERTSAVLTFLFEWLLVIPIVLFGYSLKDIIHLLHPSLVIKILAVTFLASVGMIFYLRSFKVKNISFSNIFGSSSVLVSTTLGIIIFSESTSWLKFFGIFLILAAVISLNYKNKHLEKNHFFSLLSGVIFGVCYVLDKSILQELQPLVYIFFSFFLIPIFAFLFNPRSVVSSLKGKTPTILVPICFSGLGYFLYNVMTFSAYRAGGEVGRVDAINNTAVFLVIMFEFVVMRHRHSLWRKLITAGLAYVGVALLGLA
jgi:drug/metabolite transporter (DMT)-like permease